MNNHNPEGEGSSQQFAVVPNYPNEGKAVIFVSEKLRRVLAADPENRGRDRYFPADADAYLRSITNSLPGTIGRKKE